VVVLLSFEFVLLLLDCSCFVIVGGGADGRFEGMKQLQFDVGSCSLALFWSD